MSSTDTFVLIPFVVAALVFVFRFYNREGASSILGGTFLLAIASVLLAGGYLAWGVFGQLPPYGTAAFGAVGMVLMIYAIVRMFQL